METFYSGFSPLFNGLLRQLGSRRVAVVGHMRPDGDCIGSQVALARVLRATGREAVCVNSDPVPRRLRFLLAGESFIRPEALDAGDYAAVFVDCADHDRAGQAAKARFPAPIGVIDHHLSNHGFGECNIIDAGSSATAEILAGLFLDAGLAVDAATAQNLYVGILTDTGQFRFNSTSRRTFLLAAELLTLGAKPSQAGYELYERETAGKLQLLQRFLASFRFECGGRVCIGVLPQGVFAATGSLPEDTEGLVDYTRAVDGVEIGVLIEERSDGLKASLRSKDAAFRVDLVAGKFGGGGHACAAGLNVPGERPSDFYPRLLAALEEQLRRVDGTWRHI
jgi:phosphoesterase RecJ-like protein